MHKVSIVSIGRFRDQFEKEFFNTYQKRLPWVLELVEIIPKKTLPVLQQKAYEAELIQQKLTGTSIKIALDEHGKTFTSPEFAIALNNLFQNTHHITFIIGGAAGLDQNLLQSCDMKISLSKMTWPHMIVRGMLIEQLYRAHCILSNHPYHKE